MNDTQQLHQLVEAGEWFDAAVLLGKYTQTNEDAQTWLSDGDVAAILNLDIEQLAAEFDAYCECE